MMPLPDNHDIVCYHVTKHSNWRGKYKRIFSFGTNGISTLDPETLDITNRWHYSDVISLKPVAGDSKFSITARKDKTKKLDTMTFSTEHRSDLLTCGFNYRHRFVENAWDPLKFPAFKHHWSGTRLPILLEVTPSTLDQLDTATNHTLASYPYKDIETIQDVDDVPGGFIITCKPFGRMHLFLCGERDNLKSSLQKNALLYLALDVKLQNKPVSIENFIKNRLGKYSDDEDTTSLIEFSVEKVGSRRHKDSTQRLLCLTQSCLVERDPETYHIVTLRPLASVFALIRDPENPRQFIIEYMDTISRTYHGPNRDSILATLLESVRSVGNRDVHVKMRPTSRGKRLGPYYCLLEEEVEAMHLKLLRLSCGKKIMSERIERFNCNVPYSGLIHSVTQDGLFKENKEKPIIEALQAITAKHRDLTYDPDTLCEEEIEALLQAIRRLVASKIGFGAFTQLQGFRENLGNMVIKGLRRENESITHAAIDMICALMHPMHDDYDLKQEQLNKSSLLSNSNFLNNLLDMWIQHVNRGSGALVVSAMLDMLTFALCLPYSETTEGKHFDALLEMVAKRGRSLFKLFQHPCVTIVRGAGLVMRAIIEEGELDVATRMQELALNEGALPRHLITALFTSNSDRYRLAQCHLSRHLVSLWLANNTNGISLMHRILPSGLLNYLESSDQVPSDKVEVEINVRDNLKLAQDHANRNQRNPHLVSLEKQLRIIEKHLEDAFVHWGAKLGSEKRQDKIKIAPVVLRKSRQRIKSLSNWPLFYYNFNLDHALPNLIWNHKTRDELKIALEKEVRAFESDREVSRGNLIAWNYAEFEVLYPSLKDQLCIDGYYIKILLDRQEAPESLLNISNNFFNNLYHRFLLPTSSEMKCMCLQALAIVYGRYHEMIGHFADTKYIVNMLERTSDRLERDRLLIFLHKLTMKEENIKDILDSNGVVILIDLMTLAHLHTSRAVIPTQSNVIEAGHDMVMEQEKEWHYSNGFIDCKEPVTFKEMRELCVKGSITSKTKCWAQGMDSWRIMQNVPQLKWCLLAKGASIMNESDLAILILNTLITISEYYPSRNSEDAIIWPMSRIKQALSSPQNLCHVVQLLLTFDPVIVEKVATLLCHIATDNIHTHKLYLTGVFYFILMYTGSNVLPIARFLQLTHTKQAFRGDETQSSELMQRSILGQLLPEAMVNYLENHGAEKFAHIFLGEFDTPEAIWNSEMRRMLIEKIAAHIADFSPRLCCNNRAQYQYASIPVVRYPQLHNELFCNIYYLRHLCDTTRFPDWQINDPVKLLRDVLEAWKAEVEKKPPAMSVDEAYAALEIPTGQHHDEPTLRKAYYRLAHKYHPDKNIKGREKFEVVNKAYEFLCSRSSWMENGLNTNNVLLILQTQSILFQRYSSALQPYKYAGYKQLVKTIQLETNDERLFSKQTMLLPSASELVYHTIKCSALNAEELNREGGFQIILGAYSRCVSVLSDSTKDSDTMAQVCLHCTRCFTIAASFPNCLNSFIHMPQLIADLLRILHFKGVIKLCCAVVECISSFAVNPDLQFSLLQSGVLWYLLMFLFAYDYTLEECGIERTQDANQQEALNDLAKLSVKACANLAGHLNSNTDSPHNATVHSILSRLLTSYLAKQFSEEKSHEVLKLLTSNCETPYLLWNNSTRAELLDFLEQQRALRSQNCLEVAPFTFSCHSTELTIGGIFIRIYNEQPTFTIEDPKSLVLDLMEFIKPLLNQKSNPSSIEEIKNITMALTSLYHVIDNNPGVEIQCIGHFKLLFNNLNIECEDIQIKTLSALVLVSKNQECVSDIAASGVLVYLLLVIHSLPNHHSLSLTVLHSLITSSAIVKDFLNKGGLLYLLDIILNSKVLDIKIKAAEILGRLCCDKVSGPRVRLAVAHYLPSAICDAMHEAPSSAVNLLQTDQENPEIIWNEESRTRVSTFVSKHCQQQYTTQKKSPEISVKPPDQGSLSLVSNNELTIGGVYIRLFNANPSWTVRRPVVFLTDLFDTFIKLMTKAQIDMLDPVGAALVNLLNCHPNLADKVPSIGHLPKLCSQWKAQNKTLSQHSFKIFNQLATNEHCVIALCHTDCLSPMKHAMTTHPELVNIGCDTFAKLFDFKNESLIKQAVEINLVPFLLGLLEGSLEGCDNPSRTKALVVKTLKIMTCSVGHGSSINAILEQSSIWSSFKDQNHDLFITNTPVASYLTGVPASAGYLTQGSAKIMPSIPPPVDREET